MFNQHNSGAKVVIDVQDKAAHVLLFLNIHPGHWFVKLILLGLLWAFLHHFCAGIRYLTLDMHMGEEVQQARGTSYVVFAVSLVLTLVLGVQLW